MEHSDRELACASCGTRFLFTGGEQAYYAQNGLQEPRRCKPCRAQRKTQGADGGDRGDRGRRAPGGGAGGGNAGPQGPRGTRGPRPFRPASPDDPNGYRAPGFSTQTRSEGLYNQRNAPPLDEIDEESEGQAAMLGPANFGAGGVDRFGLRTAVPQAALAAPPRRPAPRTGGDAHAQPRSGGAPRRNDRAGTDPNAYRSPAFTGSAPAAAAAPAGGPRRERRPQRMRHEATCADCGVQALVPFQPGPDRPAYCKACYQVRKANGTAPTPQAGEKRPSDAPSASAAGTAPDAVIDSAGN
jgi:CxxC-x17-CxxC domain-containing protein